MAIWLIWAEPRRVRYKTDSMGFRNDADYHNEPVLLVGDSFIAGSGNTQEDLLSAQLERDCGLPAYNLAFPGELHSYVRYVQGFFRTHPVDFERDVRREDIVGPASRHNQTLFVQQRHYRIHGTGSIHHDFFLRHSVVRKDVGTRRIENGGLK